VEKVRVLIIGTGGVARYRHIPQLLDLPEAEIVGLIDPSKASIDVTRDAFPQVARVPVFGDYHDALQSVRADAVVIASPHNQHLEHGLACLDAGLHVLMEKPFVVGSANAARLIARARDARTHLAIAYQRHIEGAYTYLRDLVRSDTLGTVQAVSAYQAQDWLTVTAGTWRQDPEIACGGQLNDSGSHLLDVILWITGLHPHSVDARIDNRGAAVDIDASLTVRFEGQALASIAVVGSASIRWWEDISINGATGTALYRNGQVLVAREGERTPVAVPAEQLPASGTLAGNFVDLILGRVSEPAAPASCGLAVARLTEAAWKSAEIGQAVML